MESIKNTYFEKNNIYIVDNFSENNSFEILREKFQKEKNVHVIQTTYNCGFSKGNQFGIEYAKNFNHDHLIISNNDIIFKKNSIKEMIAELNKNPKNVIVGPKIFLPDGSIQQSSRLDDVSILEAMGLYSIKNWLGRKRLLDQDIKNPFIVKSVSGCCFAINLKEFERMDAFDQNTFLFNEENIMAKQAERNNLRIVFTPFAEIVHEHGATTGKENLFIETELTRSTLYYWSRYRNKKKFTLLIITISNVMKNSIKYYVSRSIKGEYFSYLKNNIKLMNKIIKKV